MELHVLDDCIRLIGDDGAVIDVPIIQAKELAGALDDLATNRYRPARVAPIV